jgi:hypothetical protein
MCVSSTRITEMKQVVGCFQFFYSSRDGTLPHLDVPTRDVTNTAHAGYKTEPLLERRLENWCACRKSMVTPRVRDARQVTASGGDHYMILTTKRPGDRHEFAVGLLKFSQQAYRRLLKAHPRRWDSTHQPYPGDMTSKIVRFTEAYSLKKWMKEAQTDHMPGLRCGIVKAPPDLLDDIIRHFGSLADHRTDFLTNVAYLERKLQQEKPDKWADYQMRKRGSRQTSCLGRRCRTC